MGTADILTHLPLYPTHTMEPLFEKGIRFIKLAAIARRVESGRGEASLVVYSFHYAFGSRLWIFEYFFILLLRVGETRPHL